MTNEIRRRHELTGATLYAVILNAAGQAWNTDSAAFEAFTVANLGDYAVALIESPAGSYRYAADFPAAVAAGRYRLEIYEQAGASPEVADAPAAAGEVYWTGTKAIDPGEVLLGVLSGVAEYDSAAGVWTVKGLDGTTTLLSITLAGSGTRVEVTYA